LKEITLDNSPNQSLSIELDGLLYDLTIKETNGVMSITIIRDNVTILESLRMLPNTPLIPFEYLENGNFVMLTLDDEYPYYTQFNVTQTLIYASQDEINAIRGT
jgi:hypothetical protein